VERRQRAVAALARRCQQRQARGCEREAAPADADRSLSMSGVVARERRGSGRDEGAMHGADPGGDEMMMGVRRVGLGGRAVPVPVNNAVRQQQQQHEQEPQQQRGWGCDEPPAQNVALLPHLPSNVAWPRLRYRSLGAGIPGVANFRPL
jgi:hypothetical protein